MLDAIKHITYDNFFLSGRQRTGALYVLHNPIEWKMWFSCFPVLPGSAEIQVIWGGIIKRLLIAYFIGNISAKKISKSISCASKLQQAKGETFFETRCRVPCSSAAKTWNPLTLAGVPQTDETISAAIVGRSSPYCKDMWGRHCCLTFFPIVDTCLICEYMARQSCAMVPRWRIYGDFLGPAFPASRLQHISDLYWFTAKWLLFS